MLEIKNLVYNVRNILLKTIMSAFPVKSFREVLSDDTKAIQKLLKNFFMECQSYNM